MQGLPAVVATATKLSMLLPKPPTLDGRPPGATLAFAVASVQLDALGQLGLKVDAGLRKTAVAIQPHALQTR